MTDISPVEALYATEADTMRRLAYLMVRDVAVAEELAHEAFTNLLNRFDDLEQPGAYLRTTVVNLCRGHLRKGMTAQRPAQPREEASHPHELDETWLALGDLPEAQRTALVLRFYQDLTVADVAATMDCPVGTAKSHIHRGLARLKEVLSE